MADPSYTVLTDGAIRCDDCGVSVLAVRQHNQFHAILSSMAQAVGVLQNAHVSETAHSKYDVRKRIDDLRRMHSLTGYLEPVAEYKPPEGG